MKKFEEDEFLYIDLGEEKRVAPKKRPQDSRRRGPQNQSRNQSENPRRSQGQNQSENRRRSQSENQSENRRRSQSHNQSENRRRSQGHNQSRNRRRKNNKKENKDIFSAILIVLFIGIFIFSATQLYSIYTGYKEGAEEYKEVTELALSVPEPEIGNEDDSVPYEYYFVDFEVLKGKNSEVIGWLRFDAPEKINYPIMQANDNSKYLSTTFSGEHNSVGSIFVDKDNRPNFSDQNTVIYGHNMKDDSMFGSLNEYVSEEFYLEHPNFYIYTPDGKAFKYEVVAAEVISAYDSYRYTKNFGTATEFQTYINELSKTAYYDTDVVLDYGSKLVTLSTCTNDKSERFIVQGVRIEVKDMVKPED